jgi:hypothetical protein
MVCNKLYTLDPGCGNCRTDIHTPSEIEKFQCVHLLDIIMSIYYMKIYEKNICPDYKGIMVQCTNGVEIPLTELTDNETRSHPYVAMSETILTTWYNAHSHRSNDRDVRGVMAIINGFETTCYNGHGDVYKLMYLDNEIQSLVKTLRS